MLCIRLDDLYHRFYICVTCTKLVCSYYHYVCLVSNWCMIICVPVCSHQVVEMIPVILVEMHAMSNRLLSVYCVDDNALNSSFQRQNLIVFTTLQNGNPPDRKPGGRPPATTLNGAGPHGY